MNKMSTGRQAHNSVDNLRRRSSIAANRVRPAPEHPYAFRETLDGEDEDLADFNEGKATNQQFHENTGHDPRVRRDRKEGGDLAHTMKLVNVEASADEDLPTVSEKISKWMVNEGYRRILFAVFLALHLLAFVLSAIQYAMQDNFDTARNIFGVTFVVARSAALVIHIDMALIMLPICRTLVSTLRLSALNRVVAFDKNLSFHKAIGWSMLAFSWLHSVAHLNNVARLSAIKRIGFTGFLLVNFTTGPGVTGYVMLIALTAMVVTSLDSFKNANYERFWYTHHLFLVFFFAMAPHGIFCMIHTDNERPPKCAAQASWWKYWIIGGFVYLGERILREIRGRHTTYISRVVQHPSKVIELQIRKEKTKVKAGQYIFLCCPDLSIWQYHPYTLTSAPEDEYLSIHIRCVGNFSRRFGELLGCDFSDGQQSNVTHDSQVVRRVLPRVLVDGPFGSASEDVFGFEVALLVGAGIGVTPFASILKSISYMAQSAQRPMRLLKVYFFWICREFESFEWFHALLTTIEQNPMTQQLIEIQIYGTVQVELDEARNLFLREMRSDKDAVTGLENSPTNYGRPQWPKIFRALRMLHPATDVGLFFCGPKPLGSALHVMCNKYSQGGEGGTRFIYAKENF